MTTKGKYSLEKAIADTRIQGKLILDEDQVKAVNEFLVELKAFRKIVRKIHSLSNDLETFAMKSLQEDIIQSKSLANQTNSPYNPYNPIQGTQMMFR